MVKKGRVVWGGGGEASTGNTRENTNDYITTRVLEFKEAKQNGNVGYLTPRGAIIIWSGTIVNIPSGWILCDGTNGTPDLRSKFTRGAPAAADAGATGGSETHTHVVSGTSDSSLTTHDHAKGSYETDTQDISHTHAVGTLANAAEASHTHSVSGTTSAPGTGIQNYTCCGTGFQGYGVHTHTFSATSGAGSSHNHTISGATASGGSTSHSHGIQGTSATANLAHTHTISFTSASCSTLPSYFEVLFIYKT